jgi:phage tail sheath protein FI
MANLVSPGVSVTVTNDSFFVPASAPTLPLIFVATADEKTQSDGITPAAGTYESNVIRLVTSLQQSTQLYGVPSFLSDSAGNPQHGDARNEYGLLALNKFLGIGSSAYVVRANVNLNDDSNTIASKFETKMQTDSYVLQNLVSTFISQYNTQNSLLPSNSNYKVTVTRTELNSLAAQATADIWALYTYQNAQTDFFDNNLDPATSTSGYQIASYGGSITASTNPAGLSAQVYTATVVVDGVLHAVSINGATITTFADLITGIQNSLGSAATVTLVGGNIQITSATIGGASTVLITDTNLFKSTTGFVSLLLPTNGVQADAPLPVYGNGFSQPATGSYLGFDGMAEQWQTNGLGSTVGHTSEWTAQEAATMLLDAAAQYEFTVTFLNKTSLGANDPARRVSIVTALKAVINSNTDVRSENFEYNLIVCPGYWECTSDLVNLCIDIGEEAFVIADVPFTLTPEDAATWGTSTDRVVSTDVAYYYPGGTTTNIDGTTVYGAASGVALYTYTYSDNATNCVWFAPAGPNRGVVIGYTMGYLTGTLGTATTFNATNLNVGQRNALYQYFNNINPITQIPGRGVLVMGQKTSANAASAMDRVNVVRMIGFLRRALRKAAFSYLFEPNDQITRDNLKSAADGIMQTILTGRGLYDFLSVCDASNNNSTAIDNSELYLDIAIKPMKAVEFIYIPIRVVATGASLTTS